MEGHRGPVIVIGGGASGIIAAISVKRRGVPVIICERMDRLGKKVLASGNGRCNLSNDHLDSSHYNSAAKSLIDSVFSRFGNDEIVKMFEDLGLRVHSEEGRIFPNTNQSASVLKILEMELARLAIPIEFGFKVSKITHSKSVFTAHSVSGKKLTGRSVILACGGKSYPSLGSDGSAYAIATHFGHSIVEPVPVAVALIVKDDLCHLLQGQKISANVKSLVGGKEVNGSSGDLLFTKYGLSGTAILDVSEELSIAINRDGYTSAALSVDMIPFMSEEELSKELSKRALAGIKAVDLLTGILPNKFGVAMKDVLVSNNNVLIAKELKSRHFKVLGTRGWNEADFTAGGVDVKDINEKSLGSTLQEGLYFAGEMLDVNGKRGGFNLAWAWASGYIAGEGASADE